MSINLSKGQRIDLSKEAPGMTKVMVGLGWDVRATDGADFDLDASVFLLDASGKIVAGDQKNLVWYNNQSDPSGAVKHGGDNRTGAGDGDDETINIDLSKLPANVEKLVFVVTIYEANKRKQSFGQIQNAFIRLVNKDNDQQVCKLDLSEDMSTEEAMIMGEVYRKDGSWRFNAVGQGFPGDLAAMAAKYGLA